jgi:hypothetical protein
VVRNMYGSILRIRQLKLTLNVCDYVNKNLIQYFQDSILNVGSQVPTRRAKKNLPWGSLLGGYSDLSMLQFPELCPCLSKP